jgi:hypothetical protein
MRSLAAALVVFTALLGAAPIAAEPRLEGLEIQVLDQHGDRTLIGAHEPVPPDTSPESLPQRLFERTLGGELRLIAEGVSVAAYAPDGAVLFVQGDGLFEVVDGEAVLITRPVLGDFAIDALGTRLAVARPDLEPDAWIELIDRAGRHIAVLSEPDGTNAWPVFSPDGEVVYFISGRTGVYSWFRVDSLGRELAQVTNRGLEPGPGVLDASFVPPPASKASIRFVGDSRVRYDAGDVDWEVDLLSGEGRPVDGGRR